MGRALWECLGRFMRSEQKYVFRLKTLCVIDAFRNV